MKHRDVYFASAWDGKKNHIDCITKGLMLNTYGQRGLSPLAVQAYFNWFCAIRVFNNYLTNLCPL